MHRQVQQEQVATWLDADWLYNRLNGPPILVLHPHSALDPESEQHIQEALDRASRHRTTVTIAHRLSTIKNADIIAVVMNGVVAEQGSHSDLVGKDGIYARMWKAQTGE